MPTNSDTALELETVSRVANRMNYLIGFLFLILNKLRHEIRGYRSTRGFSSKLFKNAIAHDLRVVTRWHDYLKKYDETDLVFKGKKILELGPGSDLGVGLLLLAEEAHSYCTMDVHNLVASTPVELYKHLFDHLKVSEIDEDLIKEIQRQLKLTLQNQNDKINYQVTKDFDLSVFQEKNFDLVVSNAAFQQFDNPAQSIAQFSKLVKPGAKFIALIDLKTHTRYINRRDPLNIYRYGDVIFNSLRFKGAPNRMRSYEYEKVLKENDWTNITVFPRIQLPLTYVEKVKNSLHKKFKDPINRMENLTVVICATKA